MSDTLVKVMGVLVGIMFVFYLGVGVWFELSQKPLMVETVENFCIESGWDHVKETGIYIEKFFCYRYVDGFYEESSQINSSIFWDAPRGS